MLKRWSLSIALISLVTVTSSGCCLVSNMMSYLNAGRIGEVIYLDETESAPCNCGQNGVVETNSVTPVVSSVTNSSPTPAAKSLPAAAVVSNPEGGSNHRSVSPIQTTQTKLANPETAAVVPPAQTAEKSEQEKPESNAGDFSLLESGKMPLEKELGGLENELNVLLPVNAVPEE